MVEKVNNGNIGRDTKLRHELDAMTKKIDELTVRKEIEQALAMGIFDDRVKFKPRGEHRIYVLDDGEKDATKSTT